MGIISHSYVSAFWLQSHILRCGLNGTPMFWNAFCCACARIPDGALGKIIAARKHRALAGCKREGAVCICMTIIFSTKSFITNEQYEPRNAELYYFVYECVYINLSTKILNELFVFMLFWNNDYSRGLAGHMRPATSAVRPASAQCC